MSQVPSPLATTTGPISVQFREFRPADLDALYFLHRNHLPVALQRPYATLQGVLLEPGAGAMVVEVTETVEPTEATEATGDEALPQSELRRVIGAMIVRIGVKEDWLVLDSLVVEPPFQRRGLGRRLVAWACRAALTQQRPSLVCLVDPDEKNRAAFLEAVGFEATDLRPPASEEQPSPTPVPVLWRLLAGHRSSSGEVEPADHGKAEMKGEEGHE